MYNIIAAADAARQAAKSLRQSYEIVRNLEHKKLSNPKTGLPNQLQWVNHFHHDDARLSVKEDHIVLIRGDVEYPIDPIFLDGSVWDISKYARRCIYEMKARMAESSRKQTRTSRHGAEALRASKINHAVKEFEKQVALINKVHDGDIERINDRARKADATLRRYRAYQERQDATS